MVHRLVSALAILTKIRLALTNLPNTNALAYWASQKPALNCDTCLLSMESMLKSQPEKEISIASVTY
jgi:hypothetical protein